MAGTNAIAELSREGKQDVARILRKSRDFRSDAEVSHSAPIVQTSYH